MASTPDDALNPQESNNVEKKLTEAIDEISLAQDSTINDIPEYDTDDDDRYRLTIKPDKARKTSEKKRADAAAFEDWIAHNPDALDEERVAVQDRNSISAMVVEGSSKKIIASPREYQIDLFERAKEKNIIVVLDTGSGKTLIAALLLRHVLEQELEDRAIGKAKKIAFFIVDKVALCFQQYQVLSDNLEHPIAKFYGSMGGVVNDKAFWEEEFDKNMVVVCTADVLLNCLNSGFINIRRTNLLIFDEAHHAKKNHAYARIIKNHYMSEPELEYRPRILGMTASPVDKQTRDMRAAAAELESMLCSEIATISDEALMRSFNNRQLVESQEKFSRLSLPSECRTKLWDKIASLVGDNSEFCVALDFSEKAASELGPWPADRFWKQCMKEAEVARLIAKTSRELYYATSEDETAISAIHLAQNVVNEYEIPTVTRCTEHLSAKTESLLQVLEHAFVVQRTKRCIVFVEKRFTAYALYDLMMQTNIRIPGIVPDYMVGMQSSSVNLANMSFRDQVIALRKFKSGETNCLFATPVAEEGIDIPECDLIIRFDLYNSVIQYIQSRGRARQMHSRYISMVEDGNRQDERRIKQASRDATVLRQFCSALPTSRKVQDHIIDMAAIAEAERAGQKVHEIESSGARLSLENSMEVLAKFVSSLSTSDGNVSPEYVVFSVGRKFTADVILPETSPLNCISGFSQRNKHLARYSAAFEACMQLLRKGYINDYLQPMFAKKVPAMRNARLAVSANKKSEYVMRTRPQVWSELGQDSVSVLHLTALTLEKPGATEKAMGPLILLSRQKMPVLPDVPLFFGNGRSSLAKSLVIDEPVRLSTREVANLTRFTLQLFKDVFSKDFDVAADELPYFLAPCIESHGDVITSKSCHVKWDVVNKLEDIEEYLDWDNQPPEFYHDKLVVDPLDGSRKLIIHGINGNLKPGDPTPKGVPSLSKNGQRTYQVHGEFTIKQYSNSLFIKARQTRTWRDDQPVVEAELLSLRRNFLDEFLLEETRVSRCFVILEPLKVSPIPVDIAMMAMMFPSIIYRIDSTLIALDACSMLNLTIPPSLAIEAVTKDSDNSEEHGQEQIDFQPGMGSNYERLEYLGDTFLKMATTISLFTLKPKHNEDDNHVERMLLICNQNLFNHAVDRGLHEFIRSKAFDRRTWYPPLKLKRGKAPKMEMKHKLADKTIADVCEALIGAAYVAERGNMDEAVKAVTRMVRSKNHKMTSFAEYFAAYKIPDWQDRPHVSAALKLTVDQVEAAVGYRFQYPALLRSACKHPSYPYEVGIPNYQRLEWLGDALLDMAIVDHLFYNFPEADPQWLTEHKGAMASNQFLSCLAIKLSLNKHLLSIDQFGQVSQYAHDLSLAEEAARTQAEEEGIPMRRNFWLDAAQPPKVLADTTEALIGAMFVDSKYDYNVVKTFFTTHVLPYFENMASYDTFGSNHPISVLSRRLREDFGCSQWRVLTNTTPCGIEEGFKALTESDVVCGLLVHGKVVCSVKRESSRYGKIALAKMAMVKLGEMGKMKFRDLTGCRCEGKGDEVEDHGTAI